MGTRKGRAKGVVTPTRIMVEVSCRQLLKKKAAKSARFLSTSDVSLVKRLMILPVGVTWKKDSGALQHSISIKASDKHTRSCPEVKRIDERVLAESSSVLDQGLMSPPGSCGMTKHEQAKLTQVSA